MSISGTKSQEKNTWDFIWVWILVESSLPQVLCQLCQALKLSQLMFYSGVSDGISVHNSVNQPHGISDFSTILKWIVTGTRCNWRLLLSIWHCIMAAFKGLVGIWLQALCIDIWGNDRCLIRMKWSLVELPVRHASMFLFSWLYVVFHSYILLSFVSCISVVLLYEWGTYVDNK